MDNSETKFLDGMRIILAFWVGLGHFYQQVGAEKLFKIPLWYLFKYPGPAVDGFMLITGFLMTLNYTLRMKKEPIELKATKIKFYLRRFFRLYPVYFVIIVIAYLSFPVINSLSNSMYAFFIGGTQESFTHGINKSVNILDLITHLTFTHGFSPIYNASIISPAWSLSTEVQFYLIFPFLFLFVQFKKKLASFIIISGMLYILSDKLFGIWETPGLLGTFGAPSLIIQKLIFFTLGIVLAKYKLKTSGSNLLFLTLLIITIVSNTIVSTILCIMITVLMTSREISDYLPNFFNRFIDFIKKMFSGQISEFGANISYSFYMIHTLIIPIAFQMAVTLVPSNDKITIMKISLLIFIALTLF